MKEYTDLAKGQALYLQGIARDMQDQHMALELKQSAYLLMILAKYIDRKEELAQ